MEKNTDRGILLVQNITNGINALIKYGTDAEKYVLLRRKKAWYPFASERTKGCENTKMEQEKQAAAKGRESLQKAADTLSAMLTQEIRDLNARQRAARKEKSTAPGLMKDLKEATAMLKDLTGVKKTLSEQGLDPEGRECGVVLLPPVEDADGRKQE